MVDVLVNLPVKEKQNILVSIDFHTYFLIFFNIYIMRIFIHQMLK